MCIRDRASFEDLLAVMAALAPGHRFTLTPAKPREQAALGADVQLDGKACGYFARLSLARCRELGLGQPVYVAELDLRKMQEILTAPVKDAELPQFPDVYKRQSQGCSLMKSHLDRLMEKRTT